MRKAGTYNHFRPNEHNEPVCVAFCPTCGCHALFHYGGEQHWPPEVAAATGLPPAIPLWHCDRCQSTIAENNLIA